MNADRPDDAAALLHVPWPAVVGAEVDLRPLERADVDAWYAYLSVPAVVEHTSWNVRDPEDLVALVDDASTGAAGAPVRFAVVDRHDRTLVGTIGFPSVTPVHRTAEIAYDFAPRVAGRGVATACCRAVTDWALDGCGLVRVQATALDTNAASIRVLEKSGFAFEGRLRSLKMVRDTPRDFLLFARTTPR